MEQPTISLQKFVEAGRAAREAVNGCTTSVPTAEQNRAMQESIWTEIDAMDAAIADDTARVKEAVKRLENFLRRAAIHRKKLMEEIRDLQKIQYPQQMKNV